MSQNRKWAVGAARRVVLVLSMACWCVPAMSTAQGPTEEGEAPAWAQQRLPDWLKPSLLGKHGLPEPWCSRPGPLAVDVGGIDRWQANHFIVYRHETAKFLYGEYTPTKVAYRKGLFPALERIVAHYTTADQSDRQKAITLLTKAMPQHLLHPTVPPMGPMVPTNRVLDDEALLASGCAWCNEQARVYIRLCQIAEIPARMIFLFYSDGKMGHVVAEFYADGHWCLADSSWICVFADERGRLLSAAELHLPKAKPLVERVYMARWTEILKHSRDPRESELATKGPEAIRNRFGPSKADQFGCFGVLNYPLPPRSVP